MIRSHRVRPSVRFAALMAWALALAAAPGCDTAPSAGSVDMGGKEGRDKVKPGQTNIPGNPPAAPAPAAKKKNENFKSIK